MPVCVVKTTSLSTAHPQTHLSHTAHMCNICQSVQWTTSSGPGLHTNTPVTHGTHMQHMLVLLFQIIKEARVPLIYKHMCHTRCTCQPCVVNYQPEYCSAVSTLSKFKTLFKTFLFRHVSINLGWLFFTSLDYVIAYIDAHELIVCARAFSFVLRKDLHNNRAIHYWNLIF